MDSHTILLSHLVKLGVEGCGNEGEGVKVGECEGGRVCVCVWWGAGGGREIE